MMDVKDEQVNGEAQQEASSMILAVCNAVIGWQAHTPRVGTSAAGWGAKSKQTQAGLQLADLRNCLLCPPPGLQLAPPIKV